MKSLFGKKVRLVTRKNTYLSIQGFKAYTGISGSTVTTSKSNNDKMKPKEKSKKEFLMKVGLDAERDFHIVS